MVVYVEYALAENFLLDGLLLYLAFRAAKVKFKWKKLFFAAFLGALFALVFPLLSLPAPLLSCVKIAVGFLLCMLAFPRLKTKKEWGRYALSCAFFFAFSFAFAGAVFALYGKFSQQVPAAFVLSLSVVFLFCTLHFVRKIYEKRAFQKWTYDCAILYNSRCADVLGFLDSGNFATKNGVPVCFVSPEIAYDIWESELTFAKDEARGQVCDEITISTLGGEKTLRLFKGSLQIHTKNGVYTKKEVYFSPSANIISREYSVLLHSRIFEE